MERIAYKGDSLTLRLYDGEDVLYGADFTLSLGDASFSFSGSDGDYNNFNGLDFVFTGHGLDWEIDEMVVVTLSEAGAPPPPGETLDPRLVEVERELWSTRLTAGSRTLPGDNTITGYVRCGDNPNSFCVELGELSTSRHFRFKDSIFSVRRLHVTDQFRQVELHFDTSSGQLPPSGKYRLYIANTVRNTRYDLTNLYGVYVGDPNAPHFLTGDSGTSYRVRLVEVLPNEIRIDSFNPVAREGETLLYRLHANGVLTQDLRVNIKIDADGDFGVASSTERVVMKKGRIRNYFRLPTTDDDTDERTGVVEVTILDGPVDYVTRKPVSYRIAAEPDNSVKLWIRDNDPGPADRYSTISITAASSITEGNDAVFTITADRAPRLDLPVDLRVSAHGSYGVQERFRHWGAVTIPAGQTSAEYRVSTSGDFVDEPNGTVTVDVLSGSGYEVDFANDYTRVTIQDDDGSGPVLRVNVKDVSFDSLHRITEGETARFVITTDPPGEWVTRGNSGGVNYRLTVTGGNFNARDVANNRLPFTRVTEVGGGALGVNIYTTDDNVVQPSGRVTLTLLPHTGSCINTPCTTRGYQLPSDPHQAQASFTIRDNDGPPTRTPITRLGELPGESRLRVEWEAVPEATGYDVRWGVAAAPARQTARVSEPVYTTPELAPGVAHAFQVSACNDAGCSEESPAVQGQVAAEPVQPTANAGPDLTGAPGESVTLQGKGSTNPYGRWHQMAHQWTQLSGPPVTLTHPKTSQPASKFADPSFTIPADAAGGTTLEFQLTVTDKEGQSDSDTMIVTVTGSEPAPEPANTPPTAAIDAAQVTAAEAGETVRLQGVGNDAETAAGSLTFAWSQAGGTPSVSIVNASAATASFTAPDVTEQTSLTFRLTVTDEGGLSATAETTVTVSPPPEPANTPPTFDEGDSAERSLAENSPAGTSVGSPVTATDPDDDILTYSLSGADADAFEIDAATGQLTTREGVTYDYETKSTYAVTVTAEDPEGASASISVTVSLTDVEEAAPNNAPVFDEGTETTRTLAENAAGGENVGLAITATDQDQDTLTYSLSGADAGSFDLNAATGQLTTIDGITYDYEAKQTYSVTLEADDGNGGTATIDVTVSLTDVEEATPVTTCFTQLGMLSAAGDYAGAWDDADCKAHHQDSRGRYFQFTLMEETTVQISLSAGALYVSKDTPKNGWGSVPGPGYEHRRNVRRDNGKLVHDGSNTVTLTLEAGETYTVEAAGDGGGTFTLSVTPTEE